MEQLRPSVTRFSESRLLRDIPAQIILIIQLVTRKVIPQDRRPSIGTSIPDIKVFCTYTLVQLVKERHATCKSCRSPSIDTVALVPAATTTCPYQSFMNLIGVSDGFIDNVLSGYNTGNIFACLAI